jgi:hypothetical protein
MLFGIQNARESHRQTVPMRPLSVGNGWNDCRDQTVPHCCFLTYVYYYVDTAEVVN